MANMRTYLKNPLKIAAQIKIKSVKIKTDKNNKPVFDL